MKKIQDILKTFPERGMKKKELDEKTIVRVFLEAAKTEIRNLEDADIREVKIKNKIFYIKTAHPVISSELFLRRKKILGEVNKIAGEKIAEKVIL